MNRYEMNRYEAAFNAIAELVEKATPKKAKATKNDTDKNMLVGYICPTCNKLHINLVQPKETIKDNYCSNCGQALEME